MSAIERSVRRRSRSMSSYAPATRSPSVPISTSPFALRAFASCLSKSLRMLRCYFGDGGHRHGLVVQFANARRGMRRDLAVRVKAQTFKLGPEHRAGRLDLFHCTLPHEQPSTDAADQNGTAVVIPIA